MIHTACANYSSGKRFLHFGKLWVSKNRRTLSWNPQSKLASNHFDFQRAKRLRPCQIKWATVKNEVNSSRWCVCFRFEWVRNPAALSTRVSLINNRITNNIRAMQIAGFEGTRKSPRERTRFEWVFFSIH